MFAKLKQKVQNDSSSSLSNLSQQPPNDTESKTDFPKPSNGSIRSRESFSSYVEKDDDSDLKASRNAFAIFLFALFIFGISGRVGQEPGV